MHKGAGFRIIRQDITRMDCEAIVNTAAEWPADTLESVGAGCDRAIHMAAGVELIEARKQIGRIAEGEAVLTPGYGLLAKYIIHAVVPCYIDGVHKEEEKLRSCYRKSLELALSQGISSIAFPLLGTGSFGYPREEGFRIALDEIQSFLLQHSLEVYLVVFSEASTKLGTSLYPGLREYIDQNYVADRTLEEYGFYRENPYGAMSPQPMMEPMRANRLPRTDASFESDYEEACADCCEWRDADVCEPSHKEPLSEEEFYEHHEGLLNERLKHLSDTFSEYLMYLIERKGLLNSEVYKNAIVDKKVFSKIKNNPGYHPKKMTAMCLCVGARLNLDETKDLLARAGYALSPCEMTDVIFSYFIEHEIYDIIELDIQLEEHGLPCLITE